tara:strand:- start:173 stop:1183 length:1011 start_codon:yes stop_codon:yes gene_type:complete
LYNNKLEFRIKNKIYNSSKTLIIAEAGSNHNQSLSRAKKLIDIASKAQCDAIKFQLFKADKIIQKKFRGWKILNKLELNEKWLKPLKSYANKKGLFFGVSPFDLQSLKKLKQINVDFIKIASTEIQDLILIEKATETKKPLILSTGAADMVDISNAYKKVVVKHNNFAFLHTVSIYPANINQLNLNMIETMKKFLGVPVGFSDHSLSYIIPCVAVAKGASIIEKHITFDKKAKGPDHFFSLNEIELKKMVKAIRDTEISLGNSLKKPAIKNERKNLARRIVLKNNKKFGEKINKNDLIILRADEKGIMPIDLDKTIGLSLKKNKKKNEILKWSDFK